MVVEEVAGPMESKASENDIQMVRDPTLTVARCIWSEMQYIGRYWAWFLMPKRVDHDQKGTQC